MVAKHLSCIRFEHSVGAAEPEHFALSLLPSRHLRMSVLTIMEALLKCPDDMDVKSMDQLVQRINQGDRFVERSVHRATRAKSNLDALNKAFLFCDVQLKTRKQELNEAEEKVANIQREVEFAEGAQHAVAIMWPNIFAECELAERTAEAGRTMWRQPKHEMIQALFLKMQSLQTATAAADWDRFWASQKATTRDFYRDTYNCIPTETELAAREDVSEKRRCIPTGDREDNDEHDDPSAAMSDAPVGEPASSSALPREMNDPHGKRRRKI